MKKTNFIYLDYPGTMQFVVKGPIPKGLRAKTKMLVSYLKKASKAGIIIGNMCVHSDEDFIVEAVKKVGDGERWAVGS
jgi:hypothetical protein